MLGSSCTFFLFLAGCSGSLDSAGVVNSCTRLHILTKAAVGSISLQQHRRHNHGFTMDASQHRTRGSEPTTTIDVAQLDAGHKLASESLDIRYPLLIGIIRAAAGLTTAGLGHCARLLGRSGAHGGSCAHGGMCGCAHNGSGGRGRRGGHAGAIVIAARLETPLLLHVRRRDTTATIRDGGREAWVHAAEMHWK